MQLLIIFILLIVAGYLISMFDCSLLFLCYAPSAFIIIVLLLSGVFVKWSPKTIKRMYRHKTARIRIVIMVCFLSFFLGGWAFNRYCIPSTWQQIPLLSHFVSLIIAILLEWTLITNKKKLFVFSASLILLICLSSYIKLNNQQTEGGAIDALTSLPYLSSVHAVDTKDKSGVSVYNKEKTFNGINLFCYFRDPHAYLIDMDGTILHAWWLNDIKPHIVSLYKNGDLLTGNMGRTFCRLGWYSEVKWSQNMSFHHDIFVDNDSNIYVLNKETKIVFHFGLPVKIHNDYIAVISEKGKVLKRIDLYKILKPEISLTSIVRLFLKRFTTEIRIFFDPIYKASDYIPYDIMHNNTVTVIEQDIKGLCRKGNILISPRNLDLIGIMDADKETLIWSWGPGKLSRQHNATMLSTGNILIFDNGVAGKSSRVIEINPLTKKIVWEYKDDHFYSEKAGSAQRLPNGNTLITESAKGRVIEVTPEGEIVWEYYAQFMDADKRHTIYRMERIVNPEVLQAIQPLL